MQEKKISPDGAARGGVPAFVTIVAIVISVISLYLQKRQAGTIESLRQENAALTNALTLLGNEDIESGGSE